MGTTTVRYNTIEGYDGYGWDPDRPGNATVYANVFLTKYVGCAGGGTVSVSYDRNVFAPGSDNSGAMPASALRARRRKPVHERRPEGGSPPGRERHLRLGCREPVALPRPDSRSERPSGPVDAGADER